MNDLMLAGLAIIGTLVAIGAGGWVVRVFTSKPAKKDDPKA